MTLGVAQVAPLQPQHPHRVERLGGLGGEGGRRLAQRERLVEQSGDRVVLGVVAVEDEACHREAVKGFR